MKDFCADCGHSIGVHTGRPRGANDACAYGANDAYAYCWCPRMVRLVTLTKGKATIGAKRRQHARS